MEAMDNVRTGIDCLSLWLKADADSEAGTRLRQIIDAKGPDYVVSGLMQVGSLLVEQLMEARGVTDPAQRKARALEHLDVTYRALPD